jgi:hypothetical protein
VWNICELYPSSLPSRKFHRISFIMAKNTSIGNRYLGHATTTCVTLNDLYHLQDCYKLNCVPLLQISMLKSKLPL